MKPQQDFIIAGQFVELGQVSELTLGLGGSCFEGLRYIWLDIV